MKCNKTYASRGGAREHVRLVNKQEYYREEKVETIIPDSNIIKPNSSVIIKPLKHLCFPCKKAYESAGELDLHIMINHGSGPVVKSEEDSSAAPDAEQVDPMMISKLYKCQSVKLFLLSMHLLTFQNYLIKS